MSTKPPTPPRSEQVPTDSPGPPSPGPPSPGPKVPKSQFTLGKLLLAVTLLSVIGALMAGAFRAQALPSYPVFVILGAMGPLVILVIFGAARAWLHPDKKKRRRW